MWWKVKWLDLDGAEVGYTSVDADDLRDALRQASLAWTAGENCTVTAEPRRKSAKRK